MYDIDMFETPNTTIAELRSQGRVVICYIDIGTWENWRPDASDFPHSVLGSAVPGWPGEYYLDISQLSVLAPIMTARLDLAVSKGCQGVEPDNMDTYGYYYSTGFTITEQDQIKYDTWFASECHARNLSVGMKNSAQLASLFVDYFDWTLNEQCNQYNECSTLLPFYDAGKAVVGVEYDLQPWQFCPEMQTMGFSWLWKNLSLYAYTYACPVSAFTGTQGPAATDIATLSPSSSSSPSPSKSSSPPSKSPSAPALFSGGSAQVLLLVMCIVAGLLLRMES